MTVAVEQRWWARPICMLFPFFSRSSRTREEKRRTKNLMRSTRSLHVVALALFQCVECGVTSNHVILQQLFNNTAHAGTPTFSARVDRISPDQLQPNTRLAFFAKFRSYHHRVCNSRLPAMLVSSACSSIIICSSVVAF
jgi:hypothetical protein